MQPAKNERGQLRIDTGASCASCFRPPDSEGGLENGGESPRFLRPRRRKGKSTQRTPRLNTGADDLAQIGPTAPVPVNSTTRKYSRWGKNQADSANAIGSAAEHRKWPCRIPGRFCRAAVLFVLCLSKTRYEGRFALIIDLGFRIRAASAPLGSSALEWARQHLTPRSTSAMGPHGRIRDWGRPFYAQRSNIRAGRAAPRVYSRLGRVLLAHGARPKGPKGGKKPGGERCDGQRSHYATNNVFIVLLLVFHPGPIISHFFLFL